MKALIVSDSHGRANDLMDAVDIVKPDAVFHLGDGYKDLRGLGLMYPDVEVYAVGGNCDFSVDVPAFRVVDIEGVRIFMAHGHTYKVKYGLYLLKSAAKSYKADIAFYGHTHIANYDDHDGITVINPGSIGYSGSYGVLNINRGNFTFRFFEL